MSTNADANNQNPENAVQPYTNAAGNAFTALAAQGPNIFNNLFTTNFIPPDANQLAEQMKEFDKVGQGISAEGEHGVKAMADIANSQAIGMSTVAGKFYDTAKSVVIARTEQMKEYCGVAKEYITKVADVQKHGLDKLVEREKDIRENDRLLKEKTLETNATLYITGTHYRTVLILSLMAMALAFIILMNSPLLFAFLLLIAGYFIWDIIKARIGQNGENGSA